MNAVRANLKMSVWRLLRELRGEVDDAIVIAV